MDMVDGMVRKMRDIYLQGCQACNEGLPQLNDMAVAHGWTIPATFGVGKWVVDGVCLALMLLLVAVLHSWSFCVMVLCVALPVVRTARLLVIPTTSTQAGDQTLAHQWLLYWVVFAGFSAVESFLQVSSPWFWLFKSSVCLGFALFPNDNFGLNVAWMVTRVLDLSLSFGRRLCPFCVVNSPTAVSRPSSIVEDGSQPGPKPDQKKKL